MILLAVLVVLLLVALAIPPLIGRWRRRRAREALEGTPMVLAAPHSTARLLFQGKRPLLGLEPNTPHLMRADVYLTEDRLVIVSNEGVLIDLRRDGPHPLRSARCVGPGRLVLEGTLERGAWRLELAEAGAEQWATALAPFVRPQDAARFGSWAAPDEAPPR